jgi:fumarylacetoacetase
MFRPSCELDLELEMGVVRSKPLPAGQRLNIEDVKEHVFQFGLVLLNNWFSCDIQMFEMPPLRPFHAKGFGAPVSPWIIKMEVLQSVKHAQAGGRKHTSLPYLAWKGGVSEETLGIELSVNVLREESPFFRRLSKKLGS